MSRPPSPPQLAGAGNTLQRPPSPETVERPPTWPSTATASDEAGASPGGARLARVRDVAGAALSRVTQAAAQAVRTSGQAVATLSTRVEADPAASLSSSLTTSTFNVLDLYAGNNDLDLADELRRVETEEARLRAAALASHGEGDDRNPCRRLWRRLRQRFIVFTSAPSSWIFLVVLGVVAALIAYLADAPTAAMQAKRGQWIAPLSAGAGWVVWVLWCVAFSLLATGLAHLSPLSEGSGIPQVKALLAGTTVSRILSLRVGFMKLVGLVAALTSGLSIGKEGPFVHITSILAHNLLRLPYFKASIGYNDALKRQLLTAAVAAGVTAVFGTPVGGVLFAMETTSTYVLTAAYPRAFLAAVVCRFTFDVIAALKAETTFATTEFPVSTLSAEVLAFVLVGAACGLVGSAFVYAVNKVRIARKVLMTTAARRYAIVACVAVVVASLTYMTPYLRAGDRDAINALFADDVDAQLDAWRSPNLLFSLLLFIAVKFTVSIVSISLPVACGLFVPLFVTGAAVGRLIGEVVRLMAPGATITPGAYAVVGAAAMVSGATQTISTAVMVFELTGQTSHLLGVLLGSWVALSVASVFTISIYDLLLQHAGLPFLPRVYSTEAYALTAADVMHADGPLLTLASTHREALHLLSVPPLAGDARSIYAQRTMQFPVLSARDDATLVGCVTRAALEAAFRRHRSRAAVSPGGHATPSSLHPLGDDEEAETSALAGGRQAHRGGPEGGVVSLADRARSTFRRLLRDDDVFRESDYDAAWLDSVVKFAGLPGGARQGGGIRIDPAPFTVSALTPLSKVHYLFAICLFSELFVTGADGTFMGVIVKDDFGNPRRLTPARLMSSHPATMRPTRVNAPAPSPPTSMVTPPDAGADAGGAPSARATPP